MQQTESGHDDLLALLNGVGLAETWANLMPGTRFLEALSLRQARSGPNDE
jgi:hypothetical protein